MTILETPRLEIREFSEKDSDELALILGDPKVMEYSLKGPLSREEALKQLRQRILQHYVDRGYGLWALISKETKKLIGMAGPIVQTVDGEECVEIGYRIASSEWGKGYATEAVAAIRDYVFSRFSMDKLIAIIDPNNTQSIRVAEKTGFKLAKMTTFFDFDVGIYEIRRFS